MELKSFQQQALTTLQRYLDALRAAQAKQEQVAALNLGIHYDWLREAWVDVTTRPRESYHTRVTGAGDEIPNVCFKVPTGGGKTLLALKAVELIHRLYHRQQTGLVLWIVPTTQIYRQTLDALRDRAHPYRQSLDLTSGNRTLILEKEERFSPVDVQANLVVLMLMLPAVNRRNPDPLRLFQDRSGFEAFFPPEDQWQAHEALRQRVPNLDMFEGDAMFGGVIKSSLGNTLRLLSPLIVLDEGHKAYSVTAQNTLLGFNPSFILELSATPNSAHSNLLVDITGRQVHQEGMLKLDIHLHHRASADWRDTARASHEHRVRLEQVAQAHEAETGIYIRPINVIQVERTGEKQRGAGFIHAEEVREFLIESCGVPAEQVAIKSSERDEIAGVDLLQPGPVRYIITKQALQEGWDCPFAYVLTVLTNPSARLALTQLVGRVLRQPYARKTGWAELDESYVYCYRRSANDLVQAVRRGLSDEGLEDVAGRVRVERELADGAASSRRDAPIRPVFQALAGKVYLPCFVVPDGRGGLREIQYEVDILSRIPWEQVNLSFFDTLQLNLSRTQDSETRIGLDEAFTSLHARTARDMALDPVWITHHVLRGVANPWLAYALVQDALGRLRQRYRDEEIQRDLGFVIEELNKLLIGERRRLAKRVFLDLIEQETLRFYLVSGCVGSAIPDRVRVSDGRKLTHTTGDPLQRSLFDTMEEDLNQLEQAVALYLDRNYWVLAWYRNAVKLGYSIQGWHEHRVYSDFVVLGHDAPVVEEPLPTPSAIYVLETKGLHLKNEDTAYKQELFSLCERLSQPTPWDALADDFANHKVSFQVIYEDEWERVLNAMLQPSRE